MGADIHGFIEVVQGGRATAIAEVFIDRNYALFAALAGVRANGDEPLIGHPKGLPHDLSWQVDWAIRDDEADGWPKPMHPDYHSHSWVTAGDLEAALRAISGVFPPRPSQAATAALAMMRAANEGGGESRFVFWFDN